MSCNIAQCSFFFWKWNFSFCNHINILRLIRDTFKKDYACSCIYVLLAMSLRFFSNKVLNRGKQTKWYEIKNDYTHLRLYLIWTYNIMYHCVWLNANIQQHVQFCWIYRSNRFKSLWAKIYFKSLHYFTLS